MKRILKTFIIRQKKFDYGYYVTKNCPLPGDWKVKKVELLEKAKKGPSERAEVYNELYESSTPHNQVADLLT